MKTAIMYYYKSKFITIILSYIDVLNNFKLSYVIRNIISNIIFIMCYKLRIKNWKSNKECEKQLMWNKVMIIIIVFVADDNMCNKYSK